MMSENPAAPKSRSTGTGPRSAGIGVGRILVSVYGILALAAAGRSVFQILTKFDTAPVAYLLSAVSAFVYIVATVALAKSATNGWVVALATISFELAGVLVVGVLSVIDPALFPSDTVWSYFGRGYGFVPLVLPILGLVFLLRRRRTPKKDAS